MTRMTPRALILAALSATSLAAAPATPPAPAVAQAAPVELKDPTNAALLYYKVWMQKPFPDLKTPCANALDSDPAWRPDAKLTELLTADSSVITGLLDAAKIESADFGIQYSQGFNAVLPHLSELRHSARILACDARRCLAAGDIDGACERIAAIYAMARHLTGDRVLISSLVSIAISSLADAHMRAILANNKLTATGKQTLLEQARRLAVPDPFGTRRAFTGEQWWSAGYLRARFAGPDAGARFVTEVVPLITGGAPEDKPDHVDEVMKIREMDGRAFSAELDRLDAYYTDLLTAWDQPDALERMRTMETSVERGEYGLLAGLLVPAVTKAYKSDSKARAEHAEALKQLECFIPTSR